jgi:hypothetical protein
MGVRVSDLRNNERPLEIDLFGIKIHIWYRPMVLSFNEENAFTKRWREEQKLLEATMAGKTSSDEVDQNERSATFDYLVKLIASWDLLNDKLDLNNPIRDSEGEIVGYHPLIGPDGEVETYPTPITFEEMRDNLAPALTMSMFVEIGKDRTPNSLRGDHSVEPSSGTKSTENSQIGSFS